MSQDQEWLVRLQFLEEAQEYINSIESNLLGLSTQGVSPEGYNEILRAAHSLKGGSALMGFEELSQLAHRLEDFFKVLKAGHRADTVDASLEQLFFKASDCMGQMTALYRQRQPITADWLAAYPKPFLDELYERLGDPLPEDDIADLSAEAGEDMVSLMFSSEVEPCLDRIEGILADPAMPLLKEEFVLACQEMSGLGEMLDLPVFSGLCQQVAAALETAEGKGLVAIAQAGLEGLQRAQALVVMGESQRLPQQLDLPTVASAPAPQAPEPQAAAVEAAAETEAIRPTETIAPDLFEALTPELIAQIPEPVEPVAEPAIVEPIAEPLISEIIAAEPIADELAIAEPLAESVISESIAVEPIAAEPLDAPVISEIISAEPLAVEPLDAPVISEPADVAEPITFESFVPEALELEAPAPDEASAAEIQAPEALTAEAPASELASELASEPAVSETTPATPEDPEPQQLPAELTDNLANLDIGNLDIGNLDINQLMDSGSLNNFQLDSTELQQLQNFAEEVPAEATSASIPDIADIPETTPQAQPLETSQLQATDRPQETAQPEQASRSQYENLARESAMKVEDSTVRVSVNQLERLGELFGELNTRRGGLDLRLSSLKNLMTLLNERVKSLSTTNEKLRESYDSSATMSSRSGQRSDRHQPQAPSHQSEENLPSVNPPALNQQFDLLEMDQYSDVHLITQEIIERVVQIQEVSSDIELALGDTEGISRELSRTARQMQIGMTQVRMRPLSELTRQFPRLLRQLSLKHGKLVNLEERGTSTLIERSILEALQDPLMHLLRNCFDHGLEPTDIREAQGKSREGTIEISASSRGNQTIIVIRDDGQGINLEKIKAKIVKSMGLSRAEVDACDEQEILDMIFEPGFSTADSVTDLSGRGVGMDVVRSNLSEIHGTIQVETEAGKGTTFTLTVPLSISVTRVLVVECQGLVLAFPTSLVEEMLLLENQQLMTAAQQELLEWQGYTVPLLRLNQWLSFNRPPTQQETESRPIIDQASALLVTHEQSPYAIHCDRYWGEQEVTTRLVEGKIQLPSGFSGCVVLGDGRVAPLVETDTLLNWIFEQQHGEDSSQPQAKAQNQNQNQNQLAAQPEAAPKADTFDRAFSMHQDKKTIMVVDDSINVRRFLAITLEKAGYRIEQAKDGRDAIEKLQAQTHVDLIISDVEMPRMDGFQFLAAIHDVETCKGVPVIMLTSRSGAKHRKLAKQLGAADYFSKPFKQNELLNRLEELIESSSAPAHESSAHQSPINSTQSSTAPTSPTIPHTDPSSESPLETATSSL